MIENRSAHIRRVGHQRNDQRIAAHRIIDEEHWMDLLLSHEGSYVDGSTVDSREAPIRAHLPTTFARGRAKITIDLSDHKEHIRMYPLVSKQAFSTHFSLRLFCV